MYNFTDGFLEDVAMPVIQYESELELLKFKTQLDEVEQYKKEILNEGLQIEEEGLENIKKSNYALHVLNIASKDFKKLQAEILHNNTFKPRRSNEIVNEKKNNFQSNSDVQNIPFVQEHTFDEFENYTNFHGASYDYPDTGKTDLSNIKNNFNVKNTKTVSRKGNHYFVIILFVKGYVTFFFFKS